MYNWIMKHTSAIEFGFLNLLAMSLQVVPNSVDNKEKIPAFALQSPGCTLPLPSLPPALKTEYRTSQKSTFCHCRCLA